MTVEDMMVRLKKELSLSRYQHSIGVMEESVKLANHYNIDNKKAEIAGLLHDCAKHLNNVESVKLIEENGIQLDEIQKNTPSLYHGILAPIIAAKHYDIMNQEILDALYWHSTGRAGMTPLEKIVFVADYIEPCRNFDNILHMRKIAYDDINKCILMVTDLSIRHVLSKGDLLHPDTVSTRNEALFKVKQGIKGL
ncbi:MAG: bis(5'-nucleosyl)-tetraphosphatase (symmetrical) YqeK [Ruminiclostridium sp.]|nr:bis(5'-nucleosyl)-tetraphosphatase (symmetrical) YqeK [Ruminiclostridium sp.]